jgi:two-component system response regulator YesN
MLNRGLFLISEDLNPAVFREKTRKLLEETLASVSWYCGMGGLYRGPELYRSCSEALAELSEKRRETDAWGRARKRIAVLRQKIGFIPQDEIKAIFVSVWEPLFAEDFNSARLRMVSLFTLLLEDLFGAWSDSDVTLPFDPSEIMELADLGDWKRWAELNFDKLVLKANIDRSFNYPLPLVKAMNFIRENYTRCIQLGETAENAQVSPAHLSRLFAEHLQTGFTDYLTSLRINEAERLLRESGITVKEAAYAVGYADPNYFSRTFKKIRGFLPTELKS